MCVILNIYIVFFVDALGSISRSLADLYEGTFSIFFVKFLFFKAGIDKCTCVSGGVWPVRFSDTEFYDFFYKYCFHESPKTYRHVSDDLMYSIVSGKEVVTGVS